MLKKLVLITFVFGLAACDNVDISRYPESVQNCYNGIIYDSNNCTHSKRTIVKYCQCTTGKESEIKAKASELDQDLRGAVALAGGMNRTMGGFFIAGAQNTANEKLHKFAQKLYDDCAKKTGYTRVKNCKKPNKKSDKKQ